MPPERPQLISFGVTSREYPGFGKSWFYSHAEELRQLGIAITIGGRWLIRRRAWERFLAGEDTPAPADTRLRAVS